MSKVEPLTIRTMPPTATVSGEAWNSQTRRDSAPASSIVSASTAQNSGYVAYLMPAFSASALPRVLLVDHHDPRVGRADVDRPNPGGRDPGAGNAVHAHQLERLGQGLESRVGRAVVDRHHLQLQELRAQQRVHRGHDRRRLVVGGHENRDRHAHLRAAHGLVVAHRPALDVVLDAPPAEGGQGRVGQLEHDEVAEDEDVEAADEVLEQVGHAACLSTTA